MCLKAAILCDFSTESLDSPSQGEIGLTSLALFNMNEWFLMYICIALAGAILSWYSIFLPVRSKLIKDGNLEHPYVSSSFIATIVWVFLATLMVPFIASALLFEDKRDLFIKTIYEEGGK